VIFGFFLLIFMFIHVCIWLLISSKPEGLHCCFCFLAFLPEDALPTSRVIMHNL
jgi:hypothetical protein